jgi:hypothetical protein
MQKNISKPCTGNRAILCNWFMGIGFSHGWFMENSGGTEYTVGYCDRSTRLFLFILIIYGNLYHIRKLAEEIPIWGVTGRTLWDFFPPKFTIQFSVFIHLVHFYIQSTSTVFPL